MDYLLYAILGIAPSVIWLLFYLHKDVHPEPKRLVFLVFISGALMGPAALLLQLSLLSALSPTTPWPTLMASFNRNSYLFILNIIIFAPLTEELMKYLAARWTALKNPYFDEPIDAMIYLIVGALGFAATENLLNIFLIPNITPRLAISQATVRFLSATLLHALASGTLGYFIARALFDFKRRKILLLAGFSLAIALHGFYNYLAWRFASDKIFALAIALLLAAMAGCVGWQFRSLKKRLSICKIR
jgi:RsiW-degrading membrane proteinase PrsW (M82 family)